MLDKPIDQLVKADIDELVTEEISERRDFEYKQLLPGNSDGDTKEFLADVSAMANSSGGDLVYGIAELKDGSGQPTGLPASADGLAIANLDGELRSLTWMLHSGIAPRLTRFELRAVEGFARGPVIVLRVHRSWAGPHMVTFKNTSRFFARSATGKYQLDVGQLRAAFIGNESLANKIRDFRTDRLARIAAQEYPVPMTSAVNLVLHVMPFASFDIEESIDITAVASAKPQDLRPFGATGWNHRFNVDGFLTFSSGDKGSYAYVQVFRHGVIEAASSFAVIENGETGKPRKKFLSASWIESQVVDFVRLLLGMYEKWAVGFPVAVSISILDASGATIPYDSFMWPEPPPPVDRDLLILPEVILESSTADVPLLMRPVFDAMWQAAGHKGSKSYDQAGHWTPKQ